MPTLNIGGQKVKVDDSFLNLSPEDQNATVDEIAKGLASKRSGTIGETVDAFVRGAANAATFGFADRLAAGAGALTGIGGERGEYEKNLAKQRAIDEANLNEHPYATLGGNVAGALALPVGAAGQAATIGGRMAAGAGVGAAQGALYGAGSSPDLTNLPQVAGNMGAGAGVGLLVGGAAPAVVEGLGLAAKTALDKSGLAAAYKGFRNPEGSAAGIVADAMRRDAAAGADGLDKYSARYAIQQGQPVVTADLGGDATKRLARTAANMSDDAQRTLNNVVNDRFEAQGPRINALLQDLGGGNSVQTLDNLQTAARKANGPLYRQAYKEGAGGIWNDDLQQLTAAPAVQEAIRKAIKTGANADIAAGFPATKVPFVQGNDGTLILARNADGSQSIPSLQFWDHVQRNLRDMADSAKQGGEKHAASVFGDLRGSLLKQLDDAAPTFSKARGMAAKAFGAEDALEAGQKFASAKGQNFEYAKSIAQMSEPEKKLFTHGFLSELQAKIGEGGDRRDLINKIASSPAARQRIEMVVGQQNYAKVEVFLRAESIMDQLRKAVQGNSSTARQLADMAAIPGLIGAGTYAGSGDVKDASLAAAAAGAFKHGSAKINTNVMRHVGDLLASSNPEKITQALQTIKASKPLQEALRPFAGRLSTAILANDAERRKASETQPDVVVRVPMGGQ